MAQSLKGEAPINTRKSYYIYVYAAILLAVAKIVFHLQFFQLPLAFFALGLLLYRLNKAWALTVFFFILPLINSWPDLFFNGYPFNYMCVILFYTAGIFVSSQWQHEQFDFDFIWWQPYFLFLTVLAVSLIIVFFRWSNLLFSMMAFMKDTPVSPAGERVSFASIFPIITFFLYVMPPFMVFVLKKHRFSDITAFFAISLGFVFSSAIAVIQKFFQPDFLAREEWLVRMNQANGGFSDFNGYGLFSGVLFFYYAFIFLEKREKISLFKKWFFIGMMPVAFLGIVLSGSRTAFIFVFAVIIYYVFSKKIAAKIKIIFLVAILLFVAIGGGKTKSRIMNTVNNLFSGTPSQSFSEKIDRASNGRITMIRNCLNLLKSYPLSGVGAGNFLFYQNYVHYNQHHLKDLPLNQYLLIASEMGLLTLAVFLLFLFQLLRKTQSFRFRILLIVMILVLAINNFLWLPEAMLLFWIVIAFHTNSLSVENHFNWLRPKKFYTCLTFSVIIFVCFNLIHFMPLHPITWAFETQTRYQYGFWYPESDEQGEEFSWTKAKAGYFIRFNKKGNMPAIKIVANAPFEHLPNKSQELIIYWQGRKFQRSQFTIGREILFKMKGKPFEQGFLEFRVSPPFNLKTMKLGQETRTLGVQVYL